MIEADPSARRWRDRIPAPTSRTAAVLAVVAGSALLGRATVAALAGALIVAVVADAVRTLAPAGVGVERELPPVIALGERSMLSWLLTNPGPRPLTVSLADDLVPSLGAGTRRATVTIPARDRARVTTTLSPTRRGAFTPSRVTIRTFGPWRLTSRQADRILAGRIEVHPSFRSRREAELRITRRQVLEVGLRSARGRGRGTEFDRLRDYVPGDDVRRVDWAATGRTGRAVVRTYREERNQRVLLLLDTGRTMAGVVAGVPRLDHAMDAAMALTTVASHLGDRVGITAYDAGIRTTTAPGRGGDQLRDITRAIFALEPRLVEADHAAAFRSTLARSRRRALLVLFTELADESVTTSLVPALPLVRRDHEMIVVAARDPEVIRLERAVPGTAGEAYTAAAAAAATLRRDHTVAMLRRSGVRVVDATPDRLAGALADAYLELKATGGL